MIGDYIDNNNDKLLFVLLKHEKIKMNIFLDMGYSRSPVFNNYKVSPVDDIYFAAVPNHRSNILKTISPLSSVIKSKYKSSTALHVENISSDEEQLIENAYELHNASNSGKSYSRIHSSSKKEKRSLRDKRNRVIDVDRESRCLIHGKRRCIDCNSTELSITKKDKRNRHKHDERKLERSSIKTKSHQYSSDSEDELYRNREELKMALNLIEPSNKTTAKSTLSHKLSVIQSHTDGDNKKSGVKRKRHKNVDGIGTLREIVKRKRRYSKEYESKPRKNETAKINSNAKLSSKSNKRLDNNDIDIYDDAISLEEQELRLIALKSAVLKKHEARKKRLLANQQSIRPYSPTDSVVMTEEVGEQSNDCIDSDNNNMDISPISSPGNQCQQVDMDLASSNEDSKSPVFCFEKPSTYQQYEAFVDWSAYAMPVPINTAFIDLEQANAFSIQHPFPLVYESTEKMQSEEIAENKSIITSNDEQNENNKMVINSSTNIDNEEELRAQLIEQMRNQNSSNSCSNGALEPLKSDDNIKDTVELNKINEFSHVDSLEEDCLRSLLLSSKGRKVKELPKCQQNKLNVDNKIKTTDHVDNEKCDDLPKLTLNLREALKRLKNNRQLTNKATSENHELNTDNDKEQIVQNKSDLVNSCDANETKKTAENLLSDTNKNELCIEIDQPPAIENKNNELENMENDDANVKELTLDSNKILENNEKLPTTPLKLSIETNSSEKPSSTTTPVTKDDISTNKLLSVKTATNVNKLKPIVKQKTAPSKSQIAEKQEETNAILTSVSKINNIMTLASTLKLEALRKSTASPIVSAWITKPVKKLIIRLNEDSSSDNEDIVRDKNIEDSSLQTGSEIDPSAFQQRLDKFLLSVRANTDSVNEKKAKIVSSGNLITTDTLPKSISTQKEQQVNGFLSYFYAII